MTARGTATAPKGIENRAHPRFQTKMPVQITCADAVSEGHILDIGRGGAFIAIAAPLVLTRTEPVRLTFSLPTGVEIRAVGEVKWVRKEHSLEGPPGCGLEFLGLGRAERTYLEDYLRACESALETTATAAAPAKKYTVETSPHGWLCVRLNGFLLADESDALRDAVAKCLESWRLPRTLVLIEASGFQPCPEESLMALQDWLTLLGRQPYFGGVLIGRGTVGILQFRRIAREADVAGALASFDDEASGIEFLRAAQSISDGPG